MSCFYRTIGVMSLTKECGNIRMISIDRRGIAMKNWLSVKKIVGSMAVVSTLTLAGCQAFGGNDQTEESDELTYNTVVVRPEEPATVDGVVASRIDKGYFYSSDIGNISQVHVSDGQQVQKGDALFTYAAKEDDHELEDLNREQTNLYNQREALIADLSRLTGGTYNMVGDRIVWSYAQGRYVVTDPIGVDYGARTNTTNSSDQANNQGGGAQTPDSGGNDADSIKASIRQVNAQIKEVEIKLLRAQEKKNPTIKADYAGQVYIDERGRDDGSVPLVRIIGQGLVVNGTVDEYNYHLLENDLEVDMYINAEDRTIKGKITSYDRLPQSSSSQHGGSGASGGAGGKDSGGDDVSPSQSESQAAKFGFMVEPEEDVQIGFSTQISIPRKGFVLPPESILEMNGEKYVFKYVDGVAKKTKVKMEKIGIQEVITKGLSEGDEVIQDPTGLKDGDPVKLAGENRMETDEDFMADPAAKDAEGAENADKDVEASDTDNKEDKDKKDKDAADDAPANAETVENPADDADVKDMDLKPQSEGE